MRLFKSGFRPADLLPLVFSVFWSMKEAFNCLWEITDFFFQQWNSSGKGREPLITSVKMGNLYFWVTTFPYSAQHWSIPVWKMIWLDGSTA